MSYKTIVVHLDSGPRCSVRVDLALRLAEAQQGRVVGVVAVGRPDVIVTTNSAVPDRVECVALSASFLRQRADDVARRFEQRCLSAGARSYESRVVGDEATAALLRHGTCGDLIVVGQHVRSGTVEGVPWDLPQQVLLHGGAPVLIVPSAGAFADVGRCALVAWKNTRETRRAVRDAMPMLRRSARVVLLSVGERAGSIPDHEPAPSPVDWLASHGIAAESRLDTCPDSVDVGDEILSRAADLDAGLIVMGGYGHGRSREWLLGGVTRHLLAHMTVPTLMSH